MNRISQLEINKPKTRLQIKICNLHFIFLNQKKVHDCISFEDIFDTVQVQAIDLWCNTSNKMVVAQLVSQNGPKMKAQNIFPGHMWYGLPNFKLGQVAMKAHSQSHTKSISYRLSWDTKVRKKKKVVRTLGRRRSIQGA